VKIDTQNKGFQTFLNGKLMDYNTFSGANLINKYFKFHYMAAKNIDFYSKFDPLSLEMQIVGTKPMPNFRPGIIRRSRR
jgi:hypothetical protein